MAPLRKRAAVRVVLKTPFRSLDLCLRGRSAGFSIHFAPARAASAVLFRKVVNQVQRQGIEG